MFLKIILIGSVDDISTHLIYRALAKNSRNGTLKFVMNYSTGGTDSATECSRNFRIVKNKPISLYPDESLFLLSKLS